MKTQRKMPLILKLLLHFMKYPKSQWQTVKSESQLFFFPLDTILICAYKHVRQSSRKKKPYSLGPGSCFQIALLFPSWSGRSGIWPKTCIHTQVTGWFIACYPHSHSCLVNCKASNEAWHLLYQEMKTHTHKTFTEQNDVIEEPPSQSALPGNPGLVIAS